ncbi:MAG TPA: thioredoxin [Rhizobiales bacterium]|nr:thioredoxin [Hyphomicrobiales bacterium]
MEPPLLDQTPKDGESGLIKDTSTQGFMADVIDASREALVLVDFWAPWCGPCKQLTPVLERAVRAAGGAVRLVKLNIDEHPAIPGQLGVQSIPTVYAFKAGQPVDRFSGALPESQVKEFIARHAEPAGASKAEVEIEAAEAALDAGDIKIAAPAFAAILQGDPASVRAIAGLAKCYIRSGDLERAAQTLALVADGAKNTGAIDTAKAMLELARKAEDAGDVAELRARAESNPRDFQLRCDLAIALNAAGDHAGAAEQLLEIIAMDRGWNEGAAKAQLLQFFEAWGNEEPATVAGRQKLSLLLFS